MTLAAAGLWIASLWLVIYAIKYSASRPTLLLPFSRSRRPTTEVTVKHLNIRLKTEAFNVFHDEFSTALSSNKYRFSRLILLRLYDLGSLVGVVGMVLAFLLLFFTIVSLSTEVLQEQVPPYAANMAVKRSIEPADLPIVPASDALRLNPIIPGLTVPFAHFPLILVALATSQIVHEAGHAITAALHRIPMLSCGVAVTFVLPSAFVALPIARLEKLPPRDRLQIVTGGCFHNFLLSCLLFALAWSRAGSLPTWILFRDVSALGRLVVGLDYDSPLTEHLPIGTLITKIDDSGMGSTSSYDPWDDYLLSPSSALMQGWCAENTLLEKALDPSCTAAVDSLSCFVSMTEKTLQYKLDPVDIFTASLPRCNYSAECLPVSSCVAPRHDQQLLRISVLRDQERKSIEDIVVWKGPKVEIWEQVQVSNWRPRFYFIPYKLPDLAFAFFEYMKIANLSLYVINMLPITVLDGYQSLGALLQLFCRANDDMQYIDLEALDNTTRSIREGRVQRLCRTILSFSAISLIALSGLLGIISWAR